MKIISHKRGKDYQSFIRLENEGWMVFFVKLNTSIIGSCLAAASTGTAGGPELPGVSSPGEDFLGAGQVGWFAARCFSAVAIVPVHGVDLPESNIIRAVGVMELSIEVSTALVADDALAACLTPSAVLRAGCWCAVGWLWGSAVACCAGATWAISTAGWTVGLSISNGSHVELGGREEAWGGSGDGD